MNDPDDQDLEAVALTGPEIPRSASGPHEGEADDADPAEVNTALALAIDPDLLEAALAAVDSRSGRRSTRPPRASRPPPVAPAASGVDIDLEEPAPLPAKAAPRRLDPLDERILTLNARIREQGERLVGLEAELRREVDGRSLAESQLSEMRITLRTHGEDFDRFRQRSRKEREEAEKVGEERVLRTFLETANNVERAWHHAQSNQGQLLAGLQMIVEQFRATLRKTGVERIPASPGEPFDPEVHEAVLRVPSTEQSPGHVVDEASPGWRLRGKLFMAARVTVAEPPGSPPERSIPPRRRASVPPAPAPDPVEIASPGPGPCADDFDFPVDPPTPSGAGAVTLLPDAEDTEPAAAEGADPPSNKSDE